MFQSRLKSLSIAVFTSLLLFASLWSMTSERETSTAEATVNATILYAKPNVSILNSCVDWDNACPLRTAIGKANGATEIWVASGIHIPGNTVVNSFVLTDGLAIYGGFIGTEEMRIERDPGKYITVLSGDIGEDDITNSHGVVVTTTDQVGDNSYHVVSSEAVTRTAVLDGVTITAGQADVNSYPSHHGAGYFNNGGSPTLRNLAFVGNFATRSGGGLFNEENSAPLLSNVVFSRNHVLETGAGMLNNEDTGTISLTHVEFVDNHAVDSGGGMANFRSSPILDNVTFNNNRAENGGGMANTQSSPILNNVIFSNNIGGLLGGGMDNFRDCFPILNNVVFQNNSAMKGGALTTWQSDITMINVTLSNNSAISGSALFNTRSVPTMINSILWDTASPSTNLFFTEMTGTVKISHSLVQGSGGSNAWDSSFGIDEGNNLDEDPLFLPDPSNNLRLSHNSPSIDSGNTLSYTSPITSDLDGNARIQNSIIDMGAYEVPIHILTIVKSGSGTGTISSEPAGINCGMTCTASLFENTPVTLTAVAAPETTFTGWSGSGCTGTANCVVAMNSKKIVSATFTADLAKNTIYLPLISK